MTKLKLINFHFLVPKILYERGSYTVLEIYIGFCPRLKLDEILHNGCLGYNTDDYEALAFKCSSIVNL